MATATIERSRSAATANPWTPPVVEVGDVVLWYMDGVTTGEHAPRPAVVTKVGLRNLSLNVMDEGMANFRIKDGVRYVGDPQAKQAEFNDDGAWDLTPRHKRIDAMLAQFEAASLPSLMGAVNKIPKKDEKPVDQF